MTTCKNCKQPITVNFCPECGHPASIKRIDSHYAYHEVLHLLHFEKGFFYTVKELLKRPGDSLREYISENRQKHMKPVAFLILTSLLYTIMAHYFHAEEIATEKNKLMFNQSKIWDILHWVQNNYGYSNILLGGFIALCVRLLFEEYNYNLFEITVLLCFVMGEAMFLLTILTFFAGVVSPPVYTGLLTIISLVYPTWALGRFFNRGKMMGYFKSFAAYILGYLLFYVAIMGVGLLADLIIKLDKAY